MNSKNLFSTILFLLLVGSAYTQIDISEARSLPEGTEVTVEGIVTNGSELGIIRYLQDGTAGIAAYPGSGSTGDFPGDVQRGDLIRVRGPLKSFNELLEIDPILEYEVLSSGNPLPDALDITPDMIDEALEGQLVVIDGVKFEDGGSVFAVGNYTFNADGESSEIYVRTNHPLVGTEIPLASLELTGIVSQFNSQYQLLPRDLNDVEISDNFFISSSPEQSDLTENSFTVRWSTNAAGNSIIRYGTTPALGEEVLNNDSTTDHELTVSGLDAGEFYYVQVVSDNGSSTVESPLQYYATASRSSGDMLVYFNFEVDGSFSDGNYPVATSSGDMEDAIIEYIENANTSIDIAMYNTNRVRIVEALTDAYNRGVRVRMVTEDETANLALGNPTPPFNIIRGNADGLMHNKFLIIDPESVDNCWLITGSLNFTEQNMATDYNNMISLQDQALCKAYTIEFEEMWGSDSEVPGIFNLKFGPGKENNTPHLFSVGGTMIESYFSPTDNTTAEIAAEIDAADDNVMFALLTFTNNTLGTAMLNAYNRNVDVRGIIDNINDQGSEYVFLTDRGLAITPDFTTKSTHHKYCVVDADDPTADPVVITGSHNWSASAETRNDENTLIIHSGAIANIYRQEFEARWCAATGGSPCFTSVDELLEEDMQLFPNPVSDMLSVQSDAFMGESIVITIMDMAGRVLMSSYKPNAQTHTIELPVSHLTNGNYILSVKSDKGVQNSKFVKQ